jgi:4-hydroxybenzoate polyprenyltransferase
LKGRPILDVLLVAMGFVLRAMAGAAAVAAVISPWLVVCTFMLCLFVALAKRRSEIVALGQAAGQTRRANLFYTPANLDHMLAVSAGLSILTYSLYCLAPGTVAHVGSAHLIWTIPLVVYGMFRYYCLSLSGGQDPTGLILRDRVLWLVLLVWAAMVAAVLKWGGAPPWNQMLLPGAS